MKQEKNIWEQSRVELFQKLDCRETGLSQEDAAIVCENTVPTNCTPASKRVFGRFFWGSLRIFWC